MADIATDALHYHTPPLTHFTPLYPTPTLHYRVRLIALASQKFVSDIATDALHYHTSAWPHFTSLLTLLYPIPILHYRVRLIALASQKFVSDIATDALHYHKMRGSNAPVKKHGKVFTIQGMYTIKTNYNCI